MWEYNNELVRNELTDVNDLNAQIGQLKKQIHDLEGYINMLKKHDYKPFDSTGEQ